MERSAERLRAVADSTVTGPAPTELSCGCIVDTIGGFWTPAVPPPAPNPGACCDHDPFGGCQDDRALDGLEMVAS